MTTPTTEEALAAALRNVENETFVAALYRHGVVDSTVTNENVMNVLQRAADRGVLPVEAVLRAHAEARAEATPPPLDMERLARAVIEPYPGDPTMGRCRVCGEDGSRVGYIDQPDAIAREYAALTKPDPAP